MYINRDRLGGQLAERLPIPSLQNVTAVVDRKFPAIEGYMWRWPCRQDGEISCEVLTGREFCICCAASTGKAPRNDSHTYLSSMIAVYRIATVPPLQLKQQSGFQFNSRPRMGAMRCTTASHV